MSVSQDYRMHPKDCELFKENPRIAFAVLDCYVTFEKKIAKARKELNADLKNIFDPLESEQI